MELRNVGSWWRMSKEEGVNWCRWWNMKLLEMDWLKEVVGGNVVGRVSLGLKSLEGGAD